MSVKVFGLASLLCCDAAVSKSGLGYPCLRNVVLAQAHSQREPFKQRCSWPGNPPSSSHRASKALTSLTLRLDALFLENDALQGSFDA